MRCFEASAPNNNERALSVSAALLRQVHRFISTTTSPFSFLYTQIHVHVIGGEAALSGERPLNEERPAFIEGICFVKS